MRATLETTLKTVMVLMTFVAACGGHATPATPAPPSGEAFDIVGQGWMRIDVRVADRTSVPMMFDTGGGVTLLSKSLCDRVGCVPDGTFTGKRMSGQEITLPMARVASLEIAGYRIENARVAVLDSKELISPELGIEGVAALAMLAC